MSPNTLDAMCHILRPVVTGDDGQIEIALRYSAACKHACKRASTTALITLLIFNIMKRVKAEVIGVLAAVLEDPRIMLCARCSLMHSPQQQEC